MNEQDLHKVLKNLSEPHVVLPRHQKNLRSQLLAAHQHTVRHPFGAFLNGVNSMKKPILVVGLPLAAVAVMALAIVSFTNPAPVSARQLIEGATKAAVALSPEKLQKFNEEYKQDLINRLNEAKNDSDLKVMTEADLKAWGFIAKPTVHTHLGYTDDRGHRIIIGLDDKQEPIFVHDVDVDGMNAQGHSTQDSSSVGGEANSKTINLPHN